MGAYCHLDAIHCLVRCTAQRSTGSDVWINGVSPGNYNVISFNATHPQNQFPVPSFCLPPQPPPVPPTPPVPPPIPGGGGGGNVIGPAVPPGSSSGNTGTKAQLKKNDDESRVGPVTGPEAPPPAEGCGQSYASVDDGEFSWLINGNFGGGFGDTDIDLLAQPITMGMTPLPIYDITGQNGTPTYTQDPFFSAEMWAGTKRVSVYHEGTGMGLLVFHSPELQDYHLYGTEVIPGSAWPSTLSESTVMLHNEPGDGTVGIAKVNLAFGVPLRTTVNPGDGWLISFGVSSLGDGDSLLIFPTSTEGIAAENTNRHVEIAANLVVPTLHVTGKATIDGLIDPTGVEFAQQAANPGGVTANTIYIDSSNGHLFRGAVDLEAAGATVAVGTQEFRLCGATADPLGDNANVNTLFFTGAHGRDAGGAIALWDGAQFITLQSAEVSLALSGLANATPHDVFAFDSSGTLTLELLAWTNDTTRATALDFDQTIGEFETGDLTRRYVGTIYTTDTDETQDTETDRYIWNRYNQVRKKLYVRETTNSWTHIGAFRQANANTANAVRCVVGLAEPTVSLNLTTSYGHSGTVAVGAFIGIGIDSTTVNSADIHTRFAHDGDASQDNIFLTMVASTEHAALGQREYIWIEKTNVGTVTGFGFLNTFFASGLHGWMDG